MCRLLLLNKLPGVPVSAFLHLPTAVECQSEDLEALNDAELYRMQLDCIEWRIAVEELRDAIKTPPAVVEWNVLVRIEIDIVLAAHDRIADELRYRRITATKTSI